MQATFDRDGLILVYDDAGADSDPVLFLHGLSSSRRTWSDIIPAVADTHRVVSLDQRGHGASGDAPGTYRVEHYADDAIAVVEDVVHEPVVIVGHSLGGLVAAHIGATRPDLVRGLFLEDPPLFMGDKEAFASTMFAAFFPLALQTFTDMRARGASLAEYEQLLSMIPAPGTDGTMAEGLGPEKTREQAETWLAMDPNAFQPAIDGSLFAGYDTTASLPSPCTLLRAERDLGAAFFPEHEGPFLDASPHARVELVSGATHLIHDDRPEWYRVELVSFLHTVS
jgi:pimeloyl-ACP methyl ester carboxylesterase